DPVCEGDKIYTFTYTDCAGNESVYTYTYTIDVTTLPVVPANASSIVECIADATQPTAPVVTDVCGNDITPVITQNTDPICEGDKIYTFTYTDCAGNESIYSHTYTIDITSLPVVPANASSSVECIEDAIQPPAPVVTDVCGNTLIPVIIENTDPVCEGDKIYTFTYTDCAGNESVYTYTYKVKDNTPPVLVIPPNVTAECSESLTPIEFGEATATDNCDPNPIVTFKDERKDGVCSGTFTITRTWTATDACGNTISANQIISTSDTTAPEFDQTVLPRDIVVECDNIPDAEILTATDNCSIAIVTVEDAKTEGNCPNNYIIKRSYTATDECGVSRTHIQTITVQDTTPPVFVEALPNLNIVVQCDAIPDAETLTATDICGTASVSVSDARTDGDCPNSYTIARTWVATDACGLTTTYTQNIIVQDTTPPTFVETLPRDITVECDMIPEITSLTAIDNCGDAIVTVSDARTDGDCPNSYTIARTWIATDECGLKTTYTQVITVQDTTAPVPTSSIDSMLDVSCTDIPEVPEVEFQDNCSTNVIIDFKETNTFDESVIADYQIIRTWTVRDACNNEETYTQTLNVSLDEILNEVVAEDVCFDNGVINLENYLPEDAYGGTWEIIEGNPIATITGSVFDPTKLEEAYSEDFNPNTEGMQYVLRYTGFQTGCLNITDVIIVVDASCKVLPCGEKDMSISTAITPNGDGFNDTFDIEGITLCGFVAEVKIFNRWGALVYESNEYTLGSEREGNAFGDFGKWNGTSPKSSIGNNGKLPNGTYYYIINLRNSGLDPITGPIYLGTK
uniref:gliding motility-associated C-terminal domain-containing protein n=1 Tax=uncultured Algibacter sp. TaxID=298659 RepID=UPI002617AE7E